MYSIKEETHAELIIKHSRFLTYASPVFSKDEAKAYLNTIKKAHPDANHHCFAYILEDDGTIQKAEDDGEPSKTAGMPILETLKKNDMSYIIVVVTRYFGGVKLGAGGLIRAYGKSTSAVLEKAIKTSPTTLIYIKVSVNYDMIGAAEHELETLTSSIERTYDDKAHFTVTLKEEAVKSLRLVLKEKTRDEADIEILKTTLRYL